MFGDKLLEHDYLFASEGERLSGFHSGSFELIPTLKEERGKKERRKEAGQREGKTRTGRKKGKRRKGFSSTFLYPLPPLSTSAPR